MKTKFNGILALLLALFVQISFAQEKTITGTVSDESGPLPGVSVLIKGTTVGVATDFDGKFSIKAKVGDALMFSYVGFETQTKVVGSTNVINVTLSGTQVLDEVVVTALGISKEKKSLGYSTQQVGGDEVARVKDANFMNSLSGKISGVEIKSSGTMGGSTNVVIRGNSSLTGNNQALFVVDGVPLSNNNTNSINQQTGRGGYDYGNAASDINPDDIESINILKGGAASVLYGSSAANGVVIITTKKGKAKDNQLGLTVNSSYSIGNFDPSTYTKYQKSYGAGYGAYYGSTGYFEDYDMDGDGSLDLVTPSTEDASFGAAFDPNKLVYQWDSFYPQLPDTYLKPRPWLAANNDPTSFFETSVTAINSVSFDGATEKGTYRLAYTNFDQSGILPNSSIKKDIFDFGGSYNLNDKISVNSKVTYSRIKGKGRYGTGYDSKNPNQSFKQWYQTNVDIQEQRAAYFLTRENITWNTNSPFDLTPIYFDNPYWTRYENYQNDERNRVNGHITLTYKVNDWLDVMARGTLDTYNEIQEERVAVGSVDVSEYSKGLNSFQNNNYDLYLNFDKNFMADKLNVRGTVGANAVRSKANNIFAATTGGLVVPRLYALRNSKELSVAPGEYDAEWGRNSIFGNVSLGYDNYLYLEGSYRHEKASTLPKDDNKFDYYSVSTSFLFSKFIESDVITFGKLRAGYAETGNAADALRIYDTYSNIGNMGGNPLYSLPASKNNANLKDESTKEKEIGLEMRFINNRLGFDLSAYDKSSINQIMSVSVSNATGYDSKWVNSGEITNKGVELSLNATPIKTADFSWDVNLNWSKNKNKVVSLYEGVNQLQLASVQGGVSINATVGQPYGSIVGYNYVYNEKGEKIVASTGYYQKSASKEVIGNVNPDWIGGINNSFRYKNINFSFLIDVKKGGDVFSLDTWYGYATGIYANTVFINDLGNPVRNTLANGGGVILPGVLADGTPNTKRVRADYYANPWGYARATNAEHTYDAGFVKLREVALSYDFPKDVLKKLHVSNLTLTAIGKNLWIIDKSTPYADPEAGLSSGNIQGYQSGAYPSVKELGINLKVQF
ncbi:MAG: SusC/RagA family TonB-linked outer membrane protein [Bacteroidetes bacterium]|nr:SusC/RagA family TonB-linked outer membrane protein [Bacteroidota bacterium]